MNKNVERHEVKPQNGEDYSEGFYSSLYSTEVSFGQNEQSLIWTRYAGFLILEGFIINSLKLDSNSLSSELTLLLSIIGIICSGVWHILNHSGWLNQNIWFSKAASLNFSSVNAPMPTDWWVNSKALKPTGKIYYIAQLIPTSFIFLYSYTYLQSLLIKNIPIASYLITGFILIITIIVVTVIEHMEYSNRKKIKGNRPLS